MHMSYEKFMQIYSNLPLNVRKEVVLVVSVDGKDQPITWGVAYLEIKNRTKLGQSILNKLIELEII